MQLDNRDAASDCPLGIPINLVLEGGVRLFCVCCYTYRFVQVMELRFKCIECSAILHLEAPKDDA